MKFWTPTNRRARSAGEGRRPGSARHRPARGGALFLLLLAAGCQQLPDLELPWREPGATGAAGASNAAEPVPVAAPAADEQTVRRAQKGLAALGYRPGPADGKPGPRTRAAIAAFQEASGLPADGNVTADLLVWIESALERQRHDSVKAADTDNEASTGDRRITLRRNRLPQYRIGSTYVYSNGQIDRLTSVGGKTLRWTGTDGRLFTAYRNFLLPLAHWKAGQEEGTAELSADPGRLWPLGSDAPARFTADVMLRSGAGDSGLSRFKEDWTCRLAAGETVAVPAGRFATVKFVCNRAAAGSRPALERIWHYAPDVGHFVRRDEVVSGARSRVELVAILPGAADWPPIARAALDRAVQDALDETADGEARPWSSSGLDTSVEIALTRSYRDAGGRSCRSYTQTWKRGKVRQRYPAAACRDDEGRWVVPGLEGRPERSLSISQR